jgi:predicted phosphodiesterase
MADLKKQQELINKLKDLAVELGRTPYWHEIKEIVSNNQVYSNFGSLPVFIQAAGLEPAPRTKKLTNEIFRVDIEQHLEEHEDRTIKKRKPYPRIACLGDLHEPFSHANLKQDFKLFVEKFKPEYIIQLGDAMDQYSAAKFPRSHNVFTPKQEEELAKKNMNEFWSEMQKAAPKAKMIQLLGNHDIRPLKRTLEVMPTMEHWIEKYFQDLYTFENVHTVIDPREEYLIEDIAFHHGYRSKLGDHRDYMHMNFVGGHTHRGGVVYRNIKNTVLWELNCGLAGDPTSKGLSYTNQRMNDWTLGWGCIDEYGPRFIGY